MSETKTKSPHKRDHCETDLMRKHIFLHSAGCSLSTAVVYVHVQVKEAYNHKSFLRKLTALELTIHTQQELHSALAYYHYCNINDRKIPKKLLESP